LDETGHEGSSTVAVHDPRRGLVSRSDADFGGLERAGNGTSRAARTASIDEALGPLAAPPRGCGGGLTKNKATRILSDAGGAVLPHMR
jgi:hypothetical protein